MTICERCKERILDDTDDNYIGTSDMIKCPECGHIQEVRENEQLVVEDRPCKDCKHYRGGLFWPPICNKKLMAVTYTMRVTYKKTFGSCWEPKPNEGRTMNEQVREKIREALAKAHMKGQHNAGCRAPSYYEATADTQHLVDHIAALMPKPLDVEEIFGFMQDANLPITWEGCKAIAARFCAPVERVCQWKYNYEHDYYISSCGLTGVEVEGSHCQFCGGRIVIEGEK